MSSTVGIAALKARLSAFLEEVKAGQEIVITERGHPIARLVRLEQAELRGARRELLAKAGVLRLGTGRVRSLLRTPPRGPLEGKSVLAELLAERAEGR